jgi:hypothetical protein
MWRAALPTFEDRVSVIKEWLAECCGFEHGHDRCKQQDPGRSLPRRLLDLGTIPGTGDDLRLAHTAGLDPATTRYTTLSHCWGPLVVTPPLKTTMSSMDDFSSLISFRSLPQNFKDAVSLTRMLSIRYLWIDSLCIVQDDVRDWQAESSRMASYYQNSYLNIAAAASAHCYGGFIKDLDPSLYGSSSYAVGSYPGGVARIRTTTATEGMRLRHDLTENPLLQRAWVLQEQILSPRTVFCFGNIQMYWQCRNVFTTEDGSLHAQRLALLWYRVERPFDMSNFRTAHLLWWYLVGDYSRRRLTYRTDRGPAIAGLVEFYRYATGHTPLLGLWRETLCYDLSWAATGRKSLADADSEAVTSQQAAQFPTWSWLSAVTAEGEPNIEMWVNQDEVEAGMVATELEVLSANATWHGPPFTSGLQSAKLEVRGLAMKVALGERMKDDFVPRTNTFSLEMLEKPETAHPSWSPPRYFESDRPIDAAAFPVVTLLHLYQKVVLQDLMWDLSASFRREKTCHVEDKYLYLCPSPDDPAKFKRIGVSSERSFFPWDEGVAAVGKRILGGWFGEENRRTFELV